LRSTYSTRTAADMPRLSLTTMASAATTFALLLALAAI